MSQLEKSYLGPKLRRLRGDLNLTQGALADRLGLSHSYLNQIENNQRPVTANVLIRLAQHFQVDIAAFTEDQSNRLASDLREALADPLFRGHTLDPRQARQTAEAAPDLAHALLTAHREVQNLKERLRALDDTISTGKAGAETDAAKGAFPYEEVRDYFHYKNNYIDALDQAAERCAEAEGLAGPKVLEKLKAYLQQRHKVDIVEAEASAAEGWIRQFDAGRGVLSMLATLSASSQAFHIAHQIALLEQADLIADLSADPDLTSETARDICRIGLANYFAGAVMMPYSAFAAAARDTRHDIERLQHQFGASFEQVCHRLSNLQRPGAHGVPFFFVRVDRAGNITKRHSATKLQFARFGGACPLWNVHESFSMPGKVFVQVAETPDHVRYLSIARCIIKRAGAYGGFDRHYAVGLGCEISHAHELVYSDGLDLSANAAASPIGISCRICERDNCPQRAFPPVDHRLVVEHQARKFTPYEIQPARKA